MSPPNLRIIVIGAGIAGSNAAICLAQRGHHVTLLDYRTKLSGTFANSVHLYPNSARVVDKYGLWEPLDKVSAPPVNMRLHRGDTGQVIQARDTQDYRALYGYPYWQVMREDYVSVMMGVVDKYGVDVRLGARVVTVDEEGPAVVLESGERIEADLIVGADGIRSVVREQVIPGGKVPTASSENAYIARVPRDKVLENPSTAFMMNEHALWMSDRRIIVSSPFAEYLDLTLVYREPTDMATGEWSVEGDVQTMRSLFGGYDERIRALLERVDYCKNWRVAELPVLQSWVSEKGNCVLLGDACHAMKPSAAQGAGMGIEDGSALAECLSRLTSPSLSSLPQLLKAFETIRRPRVEKIAALARANMDIFMLPDPQAVEKRDSVWLQDPENRMGRNYVESGNEEEKKKGSLAQQGWLLGFDVYVETNKELDRILGIFKD